MASLNSFFSFLKKEAFRIFSIICLSILNCVLLAYVAAFTSHAKPVGEISLISLAFFIFIVVIIGLVFFAIYKIINEQST